MEKIEQLQQMIDRSENIVFFGGAGVSTESGIPDFRSVDGLYHQSYDYPPETIISHSFFVAHPEEFYKFYKEKYNPNAILTIVGDGEIYDEMVKKHQDETIIFKGAVADMIPEMEQADILLGVDRCMLEAVAFKKPAIVCGYKGNTVLITPKNIKQAIEENFTGINLEDDKEELFQYSEKELIQILNDNYDYVSTHLAITDSVYLEIEPFQGNSNLESVFSGLNYYTEKIQNLQKENKELYLQTQKLYKQRDELQKQLDRTLGRRIKNKLNRMR